MNTKTLQGSAIALLFAMAGAFPVLAGDTYNQSLGQSGIATDAWQLKCPLGTGRARAYVSDTTNTANNALVTVKLVKNQTAQKQDAAPASSGEGSSASADAVRTDGAGCYDVLIDKDSSGPESYRAYAYCRNNNDTGNVTEDCFIQTQNEVPSNGGTCC